MDQRQRTLLSLLSLRGLALGDAFGQRFFIAPAMAQSMIEQRALPGQPVWEWTDDTEMASAIVDVLLEHGEIDPGTLAHEFARRYGEDRTRGYGGGAHEILEKVLHGEPWDEVAGSVFGGQGSYGNGGAMRSGPIGAWFADDLDAVVEQASRSAAPTHTHSNGRDGAVAIALGAAWAVRSARGDDVDVFDLVLAHLEPGDVRLNVEDAKCLDPASDVAEAVHALGNGSRVTAHDTVGFALWCVNRHCDDYEEAMWTTVSGLGDRDTTCAIVGAITALRVGEAGLPSVWLEHLEPLSLRQL